MKKYKKKKAIVTTRDLGKYILQRGKCPTPIYHGKGYKGVKKVK